MFDSDMTSAQYIQTYTYGLSAFNFEHLASDTTGFSQKRLYNYL